MEENKSTFQKVEYIYICVCVCYGKKLLHDLKDRRGYSHLKEEALDRTM
jgi:hypothetical protein